VEYAKQLMRQYPEMKLSAVGLKSGFANEMTFFRTFKSLTDMTPREWVSQLEQA
jgi:AraC-like DNA-binding protein